jgi:putative ABC transport system permease protein
VLLRYEDQLAYWDDVYVADDNVFDVFTHEIVYGDPRTALAEPRSIAISRPMAQRYFGDENPVGRTLTTDGGGPLNVTLVFEELPEELHLRYDALIAHKGADSRCRRTSPRGSNCCSAETSSSPTSLVTAPTREYARLSEAFFEKYMKVPLKRPTWSGAGSSRRRHPLMNSASSTTCRPAIASTCMRSRPSRHSS